MNDHVKISPALHIPLAELCYRTTRSSGPGGQHVNTSDTRVELLYCVDTSRTLSSEQRLKLRRSLKTRIDTRGVIRLCCQTHRSQVANRREVTRRFCELLKKALDTPAPRVPTRPTRGPKTRRLEAKTRRGRAKKLRRPPGTEH